MPSEARVVVVRPQIRLSERRPLDAQRLQAFLAETEAEHAKRAAYLTEKRRTLCDETDAARRARVAAVLGALESDLQVYLKRREVDALLRFHRIPTIADNVTLVGPPYGFACRITRAGAPELVPLQGADPMAQLLEAERIIVSGDLLVTYKKLSRRAVDRYIALNALEVLIGSETDDSESPSSSSSDKRRDSPSSSLSERRGSPCLGV